MEALLNAIQNYVPLSLKERELIKELFSEISVSKNTHLLEAGNICKYFYFIKKGLFRHYIDEQTIHFSCENSFMCDLTSFSTQTPSVKSFEALEDSVLFRISYNDLNEFRNKVKFGERFNRLVVEDAFNKTVLYIYALQKQTPVKRYETFLEQFRVLSQRIPQYYIASYIGVTPQSLSRIRRRMIS